MRVGVLGLWHLGSVTTACVAASGIATIGVDADAEVIAGLKRGEPPLAEPGLPELIRDGLKTGRLSFTTDVGVLAAADVFTESTTFQVMQSIRLDLGHGAQVHA